MENSGSPATSREECMGGGFSQTSCHPPRPSFPGWSVCETLRQLSPGGLGQDLAQGLLKGHKTHLENPPLLWGLQGGWAHRASAAYMRAQSCTHTTRAQVYACTRVHTRTSGPAQLEGSSWTLCLAPGALPALSRAPVPRPAPHCWCSRGCTRSPLRAAT